MSKEITGAEQSVSEIQSLNAKRTLIALSIFENAHRKTLSKHLTLSGDGKLVKSAASELAQGRVRRVEYTSLKEVCALMMDLPSYSAVSFGVCAHVCARVLSKQKAESAEPGEAVVTRTRDNFHWSDGAGILLIDYDPSAGASVMNAGGSPERSHPRSSQGGVSGKTQRFELHL